MTREDPAVALHAGRSGQSTAVLRPGGHAGRYPFNVAAVSSPYFQNSTHLMASLVSCVLAGIAMRDGNRNRINVCTHRFPVKAVREFVPSRAGGLRDCSGAYPGSFLANACCLVRVKWPGSGVEGPTRHRTGLSCRRNCLQPTPWYRRPAQPFSSPACAHAQPSQGVTLPCLRRAVARWRSARERSRWRCAHRVCMGQTTTQREESIDALRVE
jgi:hypothetical protein